MDEIDYSKRTADLIETICTIKDNCSKEWDNAVLEYNRLCKQAVDTMEISEAEKIEKKEAVTTSTIIKYNSFEIQKILDSASSTKDLSAINDAIDICSKKLCDAIDRAIIQQETIYKNIIV